jgi:hypothetical protein
VRFLFGFSGKTLFLGLEDKGGELLDPLLTFNASSWDEMQQDPAELLHILSTD